MTQPIAKSGVGRAALLALGLCAGLFGVAAIDPTPPASDKGAPKEAAPADPPAGNLLIASAQIQDPRFYHAVILILRHDTAGAFGIVVNHPVGREKIADLLAAAGDNDAGVAGTIPVYFGGPVQPRLGFVVHSAEYRRADTLAIDGKVAMTASKDALRDIGHQQGPQHFFFAFGYAGWGAGQLDGEIERKDWFTMPEDPALVFDEDSSKIWDRALARRQQEL